MGKWSAIVMIMMMVIVATVTADPPKQRKDWIICFRQCSKPCKTHDGDCFERCKIKCGGPNPPHGPPHSLARISHGVASVEAGGRKT
ncbi:uncharacterized protein LOC18025685 [Eutrema salsugineum]|uniref:uncharacterized protein LOC18025685 n=1 Tax=Eutrema salsugineum TaxID=72664 RepID=UPI000CED4443|nr:uncharacterized protein LOC18025685 [Eutrema salsugineum]